MTHCVIQTVVSCVEETLVVRRSSQVPRYLEWFLNGDSIQINSSFPYLTNVLSHIWFLKTTLSVNRELGVKSLSSCTTMQLLKFKFQLWSFPAISVSVAIIEAKSTFDLVCSCNSVLDTCNGVTEIFFFANAT